MSRRLLFSILVLVLLCACCAGSGLLGRRPPVLPKVDLQAPSLQQLRDRLTVKLRGADLRLRSGEGCVVQGETLLVPKDTACIFAIPASDRFTRQLVLELQSPATSAVLRLEQPNAISVDKTLSQDAGPYALDIFRNPDKPEAVLTVQDCQVPQPEGEDAPDLPGICVLEIPR